MNPNLVRFFVKKSAEMSPPPSSVSSNARPESLFPAFFLFFFRFLGEGRRYFTHQFKTAGRPRAKFVGTRGKWVDKKMEKFCFKFRLESEMKWR